MVVFSLVVPRAVLSLCPFSQKLFVLSVHVGWGSKPSAPSGAATVSLPQAVNIIPNTIRDNNKTLPAQVLSLCGRVSATLLSIS